MNGDVSVTSRQRGRFLGHSLSLPVQSCVRALTRYKKGLGVLLAFAIGWALWQLRPPIPLNAEGVHFLATLCTAIALWVFDVFEECIVALMLLLSWLTSEIVPSNLAVSGFSKDSWFFLLGALGIGAAVNKSGLFYRAAVQVLRRMPRDYRSYSIVLTLSGVFVTPVLPEVKGRIAIISPLAQAISESIGFKPRSNGSAGLVLSAFVGYSQATFMFLTGATTCLVGWGLLPEPAKSDFGWVKWTLAALPAGVFTVLFLFAALYFLFPAADEERSLVSLGNVEAEARDLGPVTRDEWFSLGVIVLALAGWVTKPLHGIGEPWVALLALVILLMTGVLDKKELKNNIDWGFLLFFGVTYSLGMICSHFKVDRWALGFFNPLLSAFSFHPIPFLLLVLLLVYFVRFFLGETPAVIFLGLALFPWAEDLGIHPGALLLTMLMGVETWFLPYQTPSYLIAYHATNGEAFSHGQARKLMVAKFFASILAVMISVPYWRVLGLIH